MNPERFNEIRDLMEAEVLEIMRSKKPKQESIQKVKVGLGYIKAVTSDELHKLSTVVQIAGLYTQERREEIAKKIIPPMYQLIDIDSQIIPGKELQKMIAEKQIASTEARFALSEVQKLKIEKEHIEEETQKRIQAEENKVADLKDLLDSKDKTKLQESAINEYNLKRTF